MSENDPSGSSRHAMLNKQDGWFRYCRPYLEELNPRDDLDLATYVGDMVARAKGFKADTLVMMADDGGYPLFPSALAPTDDRGRGVVGSGCMLLGVQGDGGRPARVRWIISERPGSRQVGAAGPVVAVVVEDGLE